MKKLSMVLGLCLLASVSWAAAIDWETDPDIKNMTFTEGNVAYLLYGDSSGVADAIRSGAFGQNGTYGGATYADHALANSDGYYNPVNDEKIVAAGITSGTYDFFLVMFDAATVEDAANFMITGAIHESTYEQSGEPPPPHTTLTFSDTQISGEWLAVSGSDPSVPEPTALALLALGVAGLALRRRVA